MVTWSPFRAEIAVLIFLCVHFSHFLNKQQFLPFSSFVLILPEFCSIILEAFRVLPVVSYLWICACLQRPIPADKRGACAQEVPSDALEWVRKAWDLNRRVIGTFCYFIIPDSFKMKHFVHLLFLLFTSLWWGEGRGFWHPEKRLSR